MDIINQPSMAILIDCWKNDSFIPSVYGRIIKFIDNNKNIKTVVLASYNCSKERETSDSSWYLNYNNFFVKSQQNSRKIKDLEIVHRFYEKYNTKHPNENTEPDILNYKNTEKFQIAMRWRWELDLYLEAYQEIKNIYVFGMAWDMCVKDRPLGYDSLSELPNVNILTNTTCVIDSDGNSPILDSYWELVSNNTYKYIYNTIS